MGGEGLVEEGNGRMETKWGSQGAQGKGIGGGGGGAGAVALMERIGLGQEEDGAEAGMGQGGQSRGGDGLGAGVSPLTVGLKECNAVVGTPLMVRHEDCIVIEGNCTC